MDLYENPKAPLEERVQDLLSQMTLEEKSCQMATLYGSGRVLKDALPQDNWKTEVWKDGIGNIDENITDWELSSPNILFPTPNMWMPSMPFNAGL